MKNVLSVLFGLIVFMGVNSMSFAKDCPFGLKSAEDSNKRDLMAPKISVRAKGNKRVSKGARVASALRNGNRNPTSRR